MTKYAPVVSPGLTKDQFTLEDLNTQYLKTSNKLHLVKAEAVNNEIFNILSTTPTDNKEFTGEKHFEPEFGAHLNLVFEPTDAISAWEVMSDIISALKRWIPTIIISTKASKVVALDTGDGFEVYLVYYDSRLNETVSSKFIVAP